MSCSITKTGRVPYNPVTMYQKLSTVLIWSDSYKTLAEWYRQTFDLVVVEELDHPQDTGVLLKFPAGDTTLWVGQHSDVHGRNPDPARHMFNLTVDSVSAAYTALRQRGVTVIAEPFKAPTFDKYFATFADPDGNYVQIIGNK